MTQSRFYRAKIEKDFTTCLVVSVQEGECKGFCARTPYLYEPDLEEFAERYADGRVDGVLLEMVTLDQPLKGVSRAVKVTIHPVAGVNLELADLAFRTAIAKLGKSLLTSRDTCDIITAYERYLCDQGLRSVHSSKVAQAPQHRQTGSAF
tara:strand:+ start:3209 stop:3658 length:450 start_codon:yes stop_codon:yes gene_type:complete